MKKTPRPAGVPPPTSSRRRRLGNRSLPSRCSPRADGSMRRRYSTWSSGPSLPLRRPPSAVRLRGAQRRLGARLRADVAVRRNLRRAGATRAGAVTAHWNEWQEVTCARWTRRAARGARPTPSGDLAAERGGRTRASPDREAAFRELQSLVHGPDERGIVVFRGDSAYAWAGRFRVSAETLDGREPASQPPISISRSTRPRGEERIARSRRCCSSAAAPADRLSTSTLATHRATRPSWTTSLFSAPGTAPGAGPGIALRVRRTRHFSTRARRRCSRGRCIQKLHESLAHRRWPPARRRACLLHHRDVERNASPSLPRLATLGVALACVALVPLNEYSNFTRLFDPTVYFTSHRRRAHGECGCARPNECDRAARALDAAAAWPPARTSHGGGDRHRRCRPRTISASRPRARHSPADVWRERSALAHLGDSPLPGRGLGAARRRWRRRGVPGPIARTAGVDRLGDRGDRRDPRTDRVAGAGTVAMVVHISLDRRDRRARVRQTDAIGRR